MKSPAALTVLSFALLVGCPETSAADWLPDGVLVTENGGTKSAPMIVSDGSGGALVGWNHANNIHAQRLSASGNYVPGWNSLGVPICTAADLQFLASMIPDGGGGAYLAWVEYRDFATNNEDIYLHRVLADGSIAPGWPANGLAVVALPGQQRSAVLAPDGEGGVFVAWADERSGESNPNIYVQHVGANGIIAGGWPTGGLAVCTAPDLQVAPQVVADGTGGVLVSWSDARNWASSISDIFATRLDASGALLSGWSVNGNLVCGAAGGQDLSRLVADAAGGVFVAFDDFRTASPSDPFEEFHRNIYCTRMTGSGAIHPDWPVDGLPICTASQTQQALQVAPDGAGGLYLAWQDNRDSDYDVYLQRVRPNATLAPGWPVDGLQPLPSLAGFQLSPHLAPDGEQGVYLSINNLTNFYQVHTQHVTGSGALAPGWPDFGQPASSIQTTEQESQITADGFGGAIVVWKDFRNQKDDLYAKRLQPLGPTATLLSLLGTDADPDRVTLTWHVTSGTLAEARVERLTPGDAWREVGRVRPDASGRLVYEDGDVASGGRYGYRLAYQSDGVSATTAEAWVEVPARFELALAGLRPNPATLGDLTVAFTLPDAGPARLDLLDVTGRRVASRIVSGLGAGRHSVRLDEARAIAAGVYWVRLSHPSRSLTTHGVIVP